MEVRIIDVQPQPAAAVDYEVPMDQMGRKMGEVFGEVIGSLSRQGLQPKGTPFSTYPKMEPDQKGRWEVVSGFPVERTFSADGKVVPYELPGGKVAVATHMGPYDTIGRTYEQLQAWVKQHDMRPAGAMWESYLTDPNAEPDASKWRTDVYLPVAESNG